MDINAKYIDIESCMRDMLEKKEEVVNFSITGEGDDGISTIIGKTCNICVTNVEVKESSVNYECKLTATISYICLNGEYHSSTYEGKITGTFLCDTDGENISANVISNVVSCEVTHTSSNVLDVEVGLEVCGYINYQKCSKALCGGENVFVENACTEVTKDIMETEYEFVCEGEKTVDQDIDKVLSTSGCLVIDNVEIGDKMAIVCGKISIYMTYLTVGDNECVGCEMLTIPYREEVACENYSMGMLGFASGEICDIDVTVYSDETTNSSDIKVKVNTKMCISSFCNYKYKYASDVLSCTNELLITKEDVKSILFLGETVENESISEEVKLAKEFEEIICVNSSELELLSYDLQDNKLQYDAIWRLSLLMKTKLDNGDYAFELCDFEIPISECMIVNPDCIYEIRLEPLSVNPKLRTASNLTIIAEYNVCLREYIEKNFEVISNLEIGEEVESPKSAITVYRSRGGESLLKLAKKLLVSPDEIMSQNANLTFPTNKGDKVIIYRQK